MQSRNTRPHLHHHQTTTQSQPPGQHQEKKKNRRFQQRHSTEPVNPIAVVNLTNIPLSKSEHLALQKGLNFIPTPPSTPNIRRRIDFQFFERRVRLAHFFQDAPFLRNKDKSHIPSAFTPRPGFNRTLDGFLHTAEQLIINQNTQCNLKPTKENLTPDLLTSLSNLHNREDIIIKPADKGGAVVIWAKEDYINEGLRQLSDPHFYRPTATDLNPKFAKEISTYLQSCNQRNWIDDATYRHLKPKFFRTPNLYLLPKIHKQQRPVPGRPICSANDSPTEKISQYVDHFIGPLARNVPSYLRDTQHFLALLQELPTLPKHTLLATIDVTSLYTNIPHLGGIKAIRHALQTRSQQDPPTFMLLKLAMFVLRCNCFKFNEDFYHQVNGTAMGTKMAPNYAILFMAQLEENALLTAKHKPLIWWRYIDDIFIIWTHGPALLQSFLGFLNEQHPTIKFTSEVSSSEVPFLDTLVQLKPDGRISTKLYTKPTDAHLYLHYQSAHPAVQKNSIPYSQFLRIRRICSDLEDFEIAALAMSKHLLSRGYPRHLVNLAKARARHKTRYELLINEDQDITAKIPCSYIFNPRGPKMRPLIDSLLDILHQHPRTKNLADNGFLFPIIRNRNLRDRLVKADLTRNPRVSGSRPCNKPCSTCALMATANTFVSSTTTNQYKISLTGDCKSNNVIYLIHCLLCNLQYVGQTSNTIHTRLLQHAGTIRNHVDTPIANHFNLPSHHMSHLTCFIIDRPSSRDVNVRLRHESAWIRELITMTPSGINVQT